MKKTILIVGATGMIGGLVLNEALKDDSIEKIYSISRKKIDIEDKKLVQIIHNDYLNYDSLVEAFKNIDIAYFCIGVYTGAVLRDEFRKITVDYTVAFANTLKQHSPNSSFVFLSGMGADRSEKSKMMFAQDKGIAENYLIKKDFKELYIFRPGYIYPVTPRIEPNFSYKIFRYLYPVLNIFMPNSSVTSEHLAKSMFQIGLKGYKKDTLENREILSYES